MAAAPQAGLDDLSQLHSLDEDSVQDALQARYAQAKIYTHINSLLVAVNPYKQLNIYGEDQLRAFTSYGQQSPGPHVFGVAAATYRGLLDSRSQSVIISGESGAHQAARRRVLLPRARRETCARVSESSRA